MQEKKTAVTKRLIRYLILSFFHVPLYAQVTEGKKDVILFNNEQSIRKWLYENNIPALGLGVIREGKLKEVNVFGELKKNDPAPYNAIFDVASLMKPLTSMLTLKLISAGYWSLDEPICTYWTDPEVKNDPLCQKLTTRHILSHQTGFSNWRWMHQSKKLTFEFEPGTKFKYSGEGFEYLRRAIENKFKKSLEQLTDSLLFEPLGMKDTRFFWDEGMDESRFAVGHDQKKNEYKIHKTTEVNAADNLLTTVADYGTFLVSVMDGAGFSPAVFQEMIRRQVKIKADKYMGLGWEIYDLGNGQYALSHGGADQGVQAQVFLFPESKQGLIIFTNVDDGYKVYEKLLVEYFGELGKKIIAIEMKLQQ